MCNCISTGYKNKKQQEIFLIPKAENFNDGLFANSYVYRRIGSLIKTRDRDNLGNYMSNLNIEDNLEALERNILEKLRQEEAVLTKIRREANQLVENQTADIKSLARFQKLQATLLDYGEIVDPDPIRKLAWNVILNLAESKDLSGLQDASQIISNLSGKEQSWDFLSQLAQHMDVKVLEKEQNFLLKLNKDNG